MKTQKQMNPLKKRSRKIVEEVLKGEDKYFGKYDIL